VIWHARGEEQEESIVSVFAGMNSRWRRRIMASFCLALVAGLPGLAAAAEVPLPRQRPQPAAPVQTDSAPADTAANGGSQNPFLNVIKPKAPPPAPAVGKSNLPLSQQQVLANISASLASFRTMEGQFIQFGPHGEQSEGVFYIQRPGKIRFHYKPPVRLDVISDGRQVAVRDMRAMTQDLYPLSKTPLRYLLAENIDLTSDRLVRQVRQERDLIAVVIVERTAFRDGKLTLVFDPKTYELKQWIVTDAQGLNTSVAIYNVTTGKPQDPKLFRITYDLAR
jgi:outer membrane lipoprotein-sorting protein